MNTHRTRTHTHTHTTHTCTQFTTNNIADTLLAYTTDSGIHSHGHAPRPCPLAILSSTHFFLFVCGLRFFRVSLPFCTTKDHNKDGKKTTKNATFQRTPTFHFWHTTTFPLPSPSASSSVSGRILSHCVNIELTTDRRRRQQEKKKKTPHSHHVSRKKIIESGKRRSKKT